MQPLRHLLSACASISLVFIGLTAPARSADAARAAPGSAGNVSQARVLAETTTGNNWLVTGGDFGSQHFSPLKAINSGNVAQLGLAWSVDLDSPMGMANEPIVVDGVIYVAASLDRIYAIDAASGKILWMYDPHVRLSVMRNSWAARTNRGVAVWEGKVYFATGDCRLFALDAASGKRLWDSPVCVDTTVTGSTGAPRVANGLVFTGYNGSDTGVRGSMVAFDANTGKLKWRFWNVPGDPSKPFENEALEMAAKTWHGDKWWEVGGADVWDPITYDASTNLLIYGTAGATPGHLYGDRAEMKVDGDRLFSGCIIALHADTGEYAWHYQTNVRVENFHILVTDLNMNGAKRHVVMSVPRDGTFFVIDATTGKLISKKSTGLGAAAKPDAAGVARSASGHNWWPMSYNAGTGLVYLPAYDRVDGPNGARVTPTGRLIAWDPIKQGARWSQAQQLSANGGVLSTAGNLVFQGEGTGEFNALAADSGKKLWSIKTGSAIQSIPVTFNLHNEQYVVIPVGLGSASRIFGRVSAMATPESKRGPSRLLAFKLGATTPFPYPKNVIPAVPKPPAQTASNEVIHHGEEVFDKFICGDCHSPEADGTGAWILNGTIPDLRYMPQDVHDQFLAIVLGGSHKANGMPGFGGNNDFPLAKTVMTPDEANALHAYIVDLQWKAYDKGLQKN